MAEDNTPKSPSDNAIDKTHQTAPLEEYKDGNGVANKATPPEFSKDAVTIPSADDLFSKQEQDVANIILTLPRTPIPEFSVRLYRRRQLDWSKFTNAIGSTAGHETQKRTPPPKEMQKLQTTAVMGSFQFQRTVGYNFMRKSLALNYHQNTLLKTLNQNIVNLGNVLESKLEAIKLNTSVPESKKAGLFARFKEELRVQSIREGATKVRDWGKALAYPIIKNKVAIPAAQDISNIMHGRTTLVDTAKNIQQGLRNVSQSAANKLNAAADKRGDDDSLTTNSLRSSARHLTNFSDKENKPLSSKTTARLNSISGWLLRNSPSETIGNFMDKFLSDSTAPPDTTSFNQNNIDDDYGGGIVKNKTPDAQTAGENTEAPISKTSHTFSLDTTTLNFYKTTTSYLKNILNTLKSTTRTTAGGLKNPSPSTPFSSSSTTEAPSETLTPQTETPEVSSKIEPVVEEERPTYGPPQPPKTDPIRETARKIVPEPKATKLKSDLVDKLFTTSTSTKDTTSDEASPADISKHTQSQPSYSQSSPQPKDHTTFSDFSSTTPDAADVDKTDIKSLISGYMHTTANILKSLSFQNIKSNKTNEKIASSIASMKDAVISIVPKRFRKNSYDEHISEVTEETKEKRQAADTVQAETRSGGILSKLLGLFKPSKEKGSSGGEEESGGWIRNLLDIGELGEDVTLAGLLTSKLSKSRGGRGLLKVGSLIKKPAVAAASATKSAWTRGGMLGLAGLGAKSAVKGAWGLAKSPITILRGLDRGIKGVDNMVVRGMGLKEGANLLTAGAGSIGRGALSLGKGLLTTKGGLAGLGGLAINSITDHVTAKNSTANRLGHTAGTALEWGSMGALIGSAIPILGTTVGAGIGATAGAIVSNLDLVGKSIKALGHGLGYLYHGIVGEDPQISPTGKLIKPGKHGLLTGLAFASKYAQEQLLGPFKTPTITKDPSVTPWKESSNDPTTTSAYTNSAKKLGLNPSTTVMSDDALRDAYKNKATQAGMTNGVADGLNKSLLNGQTIDNQPEYKATIKLLPEYLQKHIAGSSALQFVLWSTALQHGPKDAAKIFNDDWTDGEADSEYIRKVFQSRSTRFVDQAPSDRIKAFDNLNREQSYAQAISSGATQFSFSDANTAAGNPVAPMGNAHLSVVPHTRPSSAETKKRASDAIAYLQKKGWTQEQAAGIVANLVQESGLDPKAVGDSGLAGGIAQWHPDRRTAIATKFKKPIEDMSLEEQLDAVDWEMREGSERGAGKKLAAAKSAGEAGAIVSRFYERPRNVEQEAANRGASAESFLTAYAKASSSNPTDSSSPQVADASPSSGSTAIPGQGIAQTSSASDPTIVTAASSSPSANNTQEGSSSASPASSTSVVAQQSGTESSPSISFVKAPTQQSTDPLQIASLSGGNVKTNPLLTHLQTMNDSLQSLIAQSQKQHEEQLASNTATNKGTNVVSVNTNSTTVHAAKNDIDISKPSVRQIIT